MAVFQHPHLTRGVVRTAKGAFVISRGFVSAPDDLGDSLGWRRVDPDAGIPAESPIGVRDSSARLVAVTSRDRE